MAESLPADVKGRITHFLTIADNALQTNATAPLLAQARSWVYLQFQVEKGQLDPAAGAEDEMPPDEAE